MTVTRSIELPDDVSDALDGLAERSGELPASIVAHAVREHLALVVGAPPAEPPTHRFTKVHSDHPAEVVLRQDDELQFSLVEPFRFHDGERTWEVPVGDTTDLASVPLWMTWLVPRYGRHTLPALLHDHLQHRDDVTSEEADAIFRDSMQQTGVPFVRRWAMWGAVSLRTIAQPSRGRLALVGAWVLIYGVVAGILGWSVAVWGVLSGRPSLGLVPLVLAASPLVLAFAWGRHYRSGLIAGVGPSLLAFPAVFVLWALVVYRAAEGIARLLGKGANPVRTAAWLQQHRAGPGAP